MLHVNSLQEIKINQNRKRTKILKNGLMNIVRIMPQFPRDPVIRGRGFKLRTQFDKLCKYSRK